MDINEAIKQLLINSDEIRKAYPTVTNIRHEIKDIPLAELKAFSISNKNTLHIDEKSKRAYVIHAPWVGNLDTDIWIYSNILKIQPSTIIEDGQGDAY